MRLAIGISGVFFGAVLAVCLGGVTAHAENKQTYPQYSESDAPVTTPTSARFRLGSGLIVDEAAVETLEDEAKARFSWSALTHGSLASGKLSVAKADAESKCFDFRDGLNKPAAVPCP